MGSVLRPYDFYLKDTHVFSPVFPGLAGHDAAPLRAPSSGSVSRTQFLVLETFLAQSFSSFLITVWLLLLILNTAQSGKKLSLQPQLLGAFLVAT